MHMLTADGSKDKIMLLGYLRSWSNYVNFGAKLNTVFVVVQT